MGRMWDEKMENLYSDPVGGAPIVGGYGTEPINMGIFDIKPPEYMFYLYLPVKMAGENFIYDNIPENLHWILPLLYEIDFDGDDYVYITAKNMWFERGNTYNREGWHSDGFMTDDLNYIWADKAPTEFLFGQFAIEQDHNKSLQQFSELGELVNKTDGKEKALYRLDQYVIHRPPMVLQSGVRGFVKISVSKHKYNLKGNSHNHLMDYEWEMCDRVATRNDPICEVKG